MAEVPPSNLPVHPNRLIGREVDLDLASNQLLSSDVRLLSLTGAPGVGKTRLAVALARQAIGEFPDGVCFVDLAPLEDGALLGATIARSVGLVHIDRGSAFDALTGALAAKRLLLVLDNFENLLSEAPSVGHLLNRTRHLKILTTSRERLRISWENNIFVQPLPLPDCDTGVDPSRLLENPSVELFVERAKASNADFSLTRENAPEIAALAARLDGLPLAIELAASRSSVLSPNEILRSLDDRFRILRVGAQDLPERHRTLEAAIGWSYESLSPSEARFLSQLCVFAGSFTPTGAQAMCEGGQGDYDAFEALIALTEKGLVTRVHSLAEEPRFSLLESIRDFLLKVLRAADELSEARKRHAGYYLALAERNYSEMKKGDRRSWFTLLESEHDNFRAAMAWSLSAGDLAEGKRIAAALWSPFWWLNGHIEEGLQWLEAFLNHRGPESRVDTRLLMGAGTLQGFLGNYESGKSLLLEALTIAKASNDVAAATGCLNRLGWIFWMNGSFEDASWLQEELESQVRDGDEWELAYAFVSLGSLLYEAGRDEEALVSFDRSIQLFQLCEEKSGLCLAMSKLASLKQKGGDTNGAQEAILLALEAARQLDDLHISTYLADDAARLAASRLMQIEPTRLADSEGLAVLLGAVDRSRESLALARAPMENRWYVTISDSLKRRLGERSYRSCWLAGRNASARGLLDLALKVIDASPGTAEKPKRDQRVVTLSKREREVLGLVAEGLSNRAIGERLRISERTVRFHVTSIFNKLGAETRAQAVAISYTQEIL